MYTGKTTAPAPMNGSPVSEADIQQFLALRRQHHSARKIAAMTGRSLTTVCRYLKQAGLELEKLSAADQLPETRRQALLSDYQKGYSLKYLSRRYGVPYRGVQSLVSDCPVPCHHTTGIERLQALRESVLGDYRQERIGVRDIATRFGTHEGTMRTFLAMHGVLKQRGGQPGEHNAQYKARRIHQNDREKGGYWARRVVETTLGRTLPTDWVVHHMNEDPLDQTPSNLWVFPSAAAHHHYHQQLRDSLTLGGQQLPNRLALSNGGQWLPQMIGRLSSSRDTEP